VQNALDKTCTGDRILSVGRRLPKRRSLLKIERKNGTEYDLINYLLIYLLIYLLTYLLTYLLNP